MGVPDFVKFVTRSAPGALCRIPKATAGASPSTVVFDYILVDATNALQTIGFNELLAFLDPCHVRATRAIVFALDSQRDRSGTARQHRSVAVKVGALDVEVQTFSGKLTDRYRAVMQTSVPLMLISGRGVAGEADYKLLHLQREILLSHLNRTEQKLPTFLFVSEDSDVLCGALCGPAPQQISIATKLQDRLFELAILRVNRVSAFVASCTDAFFADNEPKESVEAPVEENPHVAPSVVVASTQPSVKDDTPVPDDVVRRRKQDGPMVATGVRIELTDSSDDDYDDNGKKTVQAESSGVPQEKNTAATLGISATQWAAANITHASSVDLVFLFVMIMGNGLNLPPIIRGVTKVDISSCWQAYCKHKYKNLLQSEEAMGRCLLSPAATAAASDVRNESTATVSLNSQFLYAILESLHYADAEPRPPSEEEKARAMTYLTNTIYAVLRYIVASNLAKAPALKQTFLDSRSLAEAAVMLPPLSAVLWVLGQKPSLNFTLPLCGLSKKDLFALADSGKVASTPLGQQPSTDAVTGDRRAQGDDLDVAAHLVAPLTSASWAVRGSRSQVVPFESVLTGLASTGAAAMRNSANHSVADLIHLCHRKAAREMVSGASSASSTAAAAVVRAAERNAGLFTAMTTVWRAALALDAASLSALTKLASRSGIGAVPPTQESRKSKRADVKPAPQEPQASKTSYVYSFELRRMAPVLSGGTVTADNQGASSTSDAGSLGVAADHAGSTRQSSAQRAVISALGISYEYAQTRVEEPSKQVHLPSDAMDEEDIAEMQRLKKVARKERALAASISNTSAVKTKGGETGATDAQRERQKKNPSVKAKKGANSKRLGKKEREIRRKANEKRAKTTSNSAANAEA